MKYRCPFCDEEYGVITVIQSHYSGKIKCHKCNRVSFYKKNSSIYVLFFIIEGLAAFLAFYMAISKVGIIAWGAMVIGIVSWFYIKFLYTTKTIRTHGLTKHPNIEPDSHINPNTKKKLDTISAEDNRWAPHSTLKRYAGPRFFILLGVSAICICMAVYIGLSTETLKTGNYFQICVFIVLCIIYLLFSFFSYSNSKKLKPITIKKITLRNNRVYLVFFDNAKTELNIGEIVRIYNYSKKFSDMLVSLLSEAETNYKFEIKNSADIYLNGSLPNAHKIVDELRKATCA